MNKPSKEALETQDLRPIFDLDQSPFELKPQKDIVLYNDDGTEVDLSSN